MSVWSCVSKLLGLNPDADEQLKSMRADVRHRVHDHRNEAAKAIATSRRSVRAADRMSKIAQEAIDYVKAVEKDEHDDGHH